MTAKKKTPWATDANPLTPEEIAEAKKEGYPDYATEDNKPDLSGTPYECERVSSEILFSIVSTASKVIAAGMGALAVKLLDDAETEADPRVKKSILDRASALGSFAMTLKDDTDTHFAISKDVILNLDALGGDLITQFRDAEKAAHEEPESPTTH